MLYLVVKAVISGFVIAAVSEIAKRSPGFGALLPSLPMFPLIPALLRNGAGFRVALALGCALTIGLYLLMEWAGPRFGLRL